MSEAGVALRGARASRRALDARRRKVSVLLGLTTLLVLLASLLAMRLVGAAGEDSHGSSGPVLVTAGGEIRLDSVTPEVMSHPAEMPPAMMPDPLPEGYERVSVQITLTATGSGGLAYDGGDFRVSGPGVAPIAPHRDAVRAGTVPEGARLTGTLLFQVPVDATGLELTLPGARGALPIAASGGGGHGATEHEGSAPAPAPGASASPVAPAPAAPGSAPAGSAPAGSAPAVPVPAGPAAPHDDAGADHEH